MNLEPKSDDTAIGLFSSSQVTMCLIHTRCRKFKGNVSYFQESS